MSYDDFCRCSPTEFAAVYNSYGRTRRDGWEQMRMLALCMVQPYSKKKLQLRDIMEFAWEVEMEGGDDGWDEDMEGLSDKERFEAAKKRLGAAN